MGATSCRIDSEADRPVLRFGNPVLPFFPFPFFFNTRSFLWPVRDAAYQATQELQHSVVEGMPNMPVGIYPLNVQCGVKWNKHRIDW